jgi:voltage-gated potassium channel
VVIATAPWFLLSGLQAGQFVVALRLARLARLVVASRGSRRLFERLGRVAILAVVVLVISSLVAYHAEHSTNHEFATIGDAMWWGIVTLTTVGYGDIVPQTTTGRWAGVTIMITGIAVLGTLAGTLSSFFQLETETTEEPQSDTPSNDNALASMTAELAALSRQVEVLTERLTLGSGDDSPGGPASGDL